MKIIDYDSTGYIGRVLVLPDIEDMPEVPPFQIPGDPRTFERLMVSEDAEASFDTHYVLNDEVVARPEFSVTVSGTTIPADGQTSITISGIPKAFNVSLFGPASDTWDGLPDSVEIAVGLPGSYTVLINAFPYQEVTVKFDAT